LLGALLCDNGAYERLDDALKAECFYEPFHGRLFSAIESRIRKGQLADARLLGETFAADDGLLELGGIPYLADLLANAPPSPNAPDYARAVMDLYLRRSLLTVAEDTAHLARIGDPELSGREMIEATEARLFDLGENKGGQGFRPFSDLLESAVQMAAESYSRDGGLAGLSTGLTDLDQKTGGFHPSDLVIIAARPSMGKTSLACNIAFDAARKYACQVQPDGTKRTTAGGQVAFFSLEMSGEQLALRLLAEVSGVSGDRIRRGDIDASEFGRIRDAAMEIQGAPLYVDATGALNIAKLTTRARRLKRTTGLDLIVVDYLQLVVGSKAYRGGERVQEVSEVTQALKALAKELSVPVVALSQLSRGVESREDKRPMLQDLRESGSIEQDADMVMFIYREEYYLGRSEPKPESTEHAGWMAKMDDCRGLAELIIGKQRHGPIGTVRLSFNSDLTKFGNLARESQFNARLPYGGDA
jgi:replicative DNA helicase